MFPSAAFAQAGPVYGSPAEAKIDPACAGLVDACRASRPSLDEMFAEFKRQPLALGKVPNAKYVVLFGACKAVAAQDPGACAQLAGVSGNMRWANGYREGYDDVCRKYYNNAEFLKADLEGSPEAAKLCLQAPPNPLVKPGSAEKVCAMLTAPGAEPQNFREALRPLLAAPPSEETLNHFTDEIRFLWGDEAACEEMAPYNSEHETCLEMAAFRKAKKAGDPSLCGDHGLCAAMLGGPAKSCDLYLDRLRDVVYCPLWSDRKLAEEAGGSGSSKLTTCLQPALAKARAAGEIPTPPAVKYPPVPPKGEGDCTAGVSFQGLMSDVKEGRYGATSAVVKKIQADLLAYYEQSARLAGDPERCSGLKALDAAGGGEVSPMEQLCRKGFQDLAGDSGQAAAAAEQKVRSGLCQIVRGAAAH